MYKKLAVFLLFLLLGYPDCLAKEWNLRRSSHFIVYYKEVPEDFIENVIDTSEEYYRIITNGLGFTRFNDWSWDDRALIYIYDDAQDYVNATKQPEWSGGSAFSKEKKITAFPQSAGFFDTLLPHELGHIIFREFIGFRADVPLWLEEGVASYQEKAKRVGAKGIVKKAIVEKKFIPLTELGAINLHSAQDKDFVELFYAESGSVVYFLLTRFNRYNFVDFCKALRDGVSFDQALHKGYPRFDDLEDLNREWVRYLTNE